MKKEVNKEIIKEIIRAVVIIVIFSIFMFNYRDNSSNIQPQEGDHRQDSETGAYEVYYKGNWVDERYYDHIMEEKYEYEREAQEYATLYYIDNGYYFHNDINCRGLDGYRDNLNITYPDELIEHQELSPCNWCVKGNN